MTNVNVENLKKEVAKAVKSATSDFQYNAAVSKELGLIPEQSGFFYRKNGEKIEVMVDDGQNHPVIQTVDDFLKSFELPSGNANSTLSLESFCDSVETAIWLDSVEGKTVYAWDLNHFLKNFYDGFAKLFLKTENGVVTIIEEYDKYGEDSVTLTKKEFLDEWCYYFYADNVSE